MMLLKRHCSTEKEYDEGIVNGMTYDNLEHACQQW